jgi:hypothetical protein
MDVTLKHICVTTLGFRIYQNTYLIIFVYTPFQVYPVYNLHFYHIFYPQIQLRVYQVSIFLVYPNWYILCTILI